MPPRPVLRIRYAVLTLVLLLVEVLIALFVQDDFVRPYVGDLLVVVLLCAFLRVFMPRGAALLPLYVTLFAVAVELLQLLRLTDLPALAGSRFFRILLGTVFDWRDILCYLAGGALSLAVDSLFRRDGSA